MKKSISALCATAILANLTGCGTLLYPERAGQGRGGRLDIGIVLLDGVGLLCFVIPGVIAYAVDFLNGTIYLPHGSHANANIENIDTKDMIAVNVGKENLTPEKIKEVVSANAGHDVDIANAEAYKIKANGQKVKVDNKLFM